MAPYLIIRNLFSNIIQVVVGRSRTLINKSARGIDAEAGVVGGIGKGSTGYWNIFVARRVGIRVWLLLLLLLALPRPGRSRETRAGTGTGSCSCCMKVIMIPPVWLCRGRDDNTVNSTIESALVSCHWSLAVCLNDLFLWLRNGCMLGALEYSFWSLLFVGFDVLRLMKVGDIYRWVWWRMEVCEVWIIGETIKYGRLSFPLSSWAIIKYVNGATTWATPPNPTHPKSFV